MPTTRVASQLTGTTGSTSMYPIGKVYFMDCESVMGGPCTALSNFDRSHISWFGKLLWCSRRWSSWCLWGSMMLVLVILRCCWCSVLKLLRVASLSFEYIACRRVWPILRYLSAWPCVPCRVEDHNYYVFLFLLAYHLALNCSGSCLSARRDGNPWVVFTADFNTALPIFSYMHWLEQIFCHESNL